MDEFGVLYYKLSLEEPMEMFFIKTEYGFILKKLTWKFKEPLISIEPSPDTQSLFGHFGKENTFGFSGNFSNCTLEYQISQKISSLSNVNTFSTEELYNACRQALEKLSLNNTESQRLLKKKKYEQQRTPRFTVEFETEKKKTKLRTKILSNDEIPNVSIDDEEFIADFSTEKCTPMREFYENQRQRQQQQDVNKKSDSNVNFSKEKEHCFTENNTTTNSFKKKSMFSVSRNLFSENNEIKV